MTVSFLFLVVSAHDMHHPHPPDAYQIPDFIKVELNETDNQTGLYSLEIYKF